MDQRAVNLSRHLYELKKKSQTLTNNNARMVDKLDITESNIINTMLGLCEIYEMCLSFQTVSLCSIDDEMVGLSNSNIPIVYATLIKNNAKTIDEVPNNLKSEVEKILTELD